MKKLMRQIYARIWYRWRLFKLQFIKIPESEDGKSQEQLLNEIKDRLNLK